MTTYTRDEVEFIDALTSKVLRKKAFALYGVSSRIQFGVREQVRRIKAGQARIVALKVAKLPQRPPSEFQKIVDFQKLSPKQQLEQFGAKLRSGELSTTRLGIPGQTLAGRAIERVSSRITLSLQSTGRILKQIETSKGFQERFGKLGIITERRLGREMEGLSVDIGNFNRKYGGRRLTAEE